MQQIATKHSAVLRRVGLERVAFDAAAGWRDLWRVLRVGLCYGAAIAVDSLALAVTLLATGWASLVMALRR